MADNRDVLLFIRLLQSKQGQDVIEAFRASYDDTQDLAQAFEAAKQVAESNGVWIPFQIAFFLDILKIIADNVNRRNNNQGR
jgi:hypothetical protein